MPTSSAHIGCMDVVSVSKANNFCFARSAKNLWNFFGVSIS